MSSGEAKVRPLAGVRIVEFEGIGPGPLAGMILADMGAEVVLISRPQLMALQREFAEKNAGADGEKIAPHVGNPLHRGKRSLALDLKQAAGVA